MRRLTLPVLLLFLIPACNTSNGAPTAPNTPPANQSPVVTAVSANPTFGIAGLQVFNLTASASDPDGDALTYSWQVGGQPFSGQSLQLIANGPGNFTATVTVTDGRGGSGAGSANFVAGSMAGQWSVSTGPLAGMMLNLQQSPSGIVQGTWSLPALGAVGETDPDQPGSITASGQMTMRLKVTNGSFLDFNMSGTMDTTGLRVTGTIEGSGFSGQPFVMNKQ